MHGRLLLAAAALAVINLSSPARAVTVSGAEVIHITSAKPDWLQVGEVVAIKAGTVTDVALASQGATVSVANSYGNGTAPSYAIDGLYPASYPNIYHSSTDTSASYLDVILASPTDLASLTIYGRLDSYSYRDNYNVQIFDASNVLLYSGNLDGGNAFGRGATVTFDVAVATTPLPPTWTMLIAGFVGLGLFARRGARKAAAAAV